MPESLDDRLKVAQRDLEREILVPDLSAVRERARRIRRRRSARTAATAALALIAVVGLGTAAVHSGRSRLDSGPAAVATGSGLSWRGAGITLLGLDGLVLDQPGDLVDIEFGDNERGYALTSACDGGRPCHVMLAATTDGGHTWTDWPLPFEDADATAMPRLYAVGDGVIIADTVREAFWFGRSPDASWQPQIIQLESAPGITAIPPDGRLWSTRDTCGGSLYVWQADRRPSRLASAPSMTICSVAPARTADGAWWIGGRTADGTAPAVGVSHDNGASWQVTALPPGDGTARVSTVGDRLFVGVITAGNGIPDATSQTIKAVYRSVHGGPLTPYTEGSGTLVGDLVPLLDGRLVAAGPDWQISAGSGAPFGHAGGSLPWVRSLVRTPGAWVAYDLFHAGWAAVSYDGATWQKINIH